MTPERSLVVGSATPAPGIPWPPSRDRLQADIDRLLEFAAEVLEDWFESGNGDVLQEIGERYGLLQAVQASEPCGTVCSCADYGADFPTTCYRYAPKVREAFDRLRRRERGA